MFLLDTLFSELEVYTVTEIISVIAYKPRITIPIYKTV